MTAAYLDVHAAAAHFGVSVSFLNQLRVRGCGPKFIKVGRLVRYSLEELDRWMSERVVESTSSHLARME